MTNAVSSKKLAAFLLRLSIFTTISKREHQAIKLGDHTHLASKAYRKIELALLPLPDDQYISKGSVQER